MPTIPDTATGPFTAETASPPPGTVATEVPAPGMVGPEPALVADDLLVEDVSIDGMCGVY